MITALPPLVAACLLIAAQAGRGAEPSPQDLADQLTGDAAAPASENPQCALFTPDEISAYVGASVGRGGNAGMGMGCQWLALTGEGDAMLMAVPADYAERPTLAPGFRPAPDIGPDAFVVPEMGGWAAAATAGDAFVKVTLVGPAASEAGARALLIETLARRGP